MSTNDNSDRRNTASNSGRGSVATNGDASYADSSMRSTGMASAGTGAASTSNVFGASAVVSSATLASYVTGVRVDFSQTPGGATNMVNNSLTTGDGAFQNLAGLQSLNMNTGAGASQNSAVNVSVAAGTINLGGGQ
jgi:hypothetical protein